MQIVSSEKNFLVELVFVRKILSTLETKFVFLA